MKALAIASLALAACSAPPPPADGPPLEIPSYAADDPRPKTGGFVREVRLHEQQCGDTLYVLMAFVVGDTLTLGAMTRGPFEGTAAWTVGARAVEVEFTAEPKSGQVPARAENAPAGAELFGEKAGFRDFQWINVDVTAGAWLPDDVTAVSLTFRGTDGTAVAMPASGHFAARRIQR